MEATVYTTSSVMAKPSQSLKREDLFLI